MDEVPEINDTWTAKVINNDFLKKKKRLLKVEHYMKVYERGKYHSLLYNEDRNHWTI